MEALRGLIERAHALQQLAGLSRPTHSSESVEDEEEKEGEAVESDRGEAPLLGFGDSQREKLFLDTLRRAENVMSSVAEGARMRTQLLEAIERRDAEVCHGIWSGDPARSQSWVSRMLHVGITPSYFSSPALVELEMNCSPCIVPARPARVEMHPWHQ